MVPHSWINKFMEICGVADISTFVPKYKQLENDLNVREGKAR